MRIHFIGIGGIGISALSIYLRAQGHTISGSDIASNKITKALQEEGVKITIPHNPSAIKSNFDLVIHSAIIKPDNCEILAAKKLQIPVLSRKDALNFILQEKNVLSVCGAHGKSSTTAMLASILPECSALIGAISKEFNSNVREVLGSELIFEADESDRSFLHSNPLVACVTNIEAEHLESYEDDYELLKKSYLEFMNSAKVAVINSEDKISKDFLDKGLITTRTVVLNPAKDIGMNVFCGLDSTGVEENLPVTKFIMDLESKTGFLGLESKIVKKDITVYGLGSHVVLNAALSLLASIAFLEELNKPVDLDKLIYNLKKFRGTKKRFDILQTISQERACIIDDYAHHPTEIRATLDSIELYKDLHPMPFKEAKVTAIFQPHKYSRLLANLEDFKTCFKCADTLVILPVWAASEKKVDVDLKEIFKDYCPILASKVRRKGEVLEVLDEKENIILTLDSGFIVGLGAGDITNQLRGES
ncbi:UDP-N-acetylmuramate--L-alanine ligase [Helicobacter sp. 13S00401-1]|uniref:UDP-N-acetylmuramate--L-alanine ligase n=1 Tax=Helicobacter sp. 13S00401-1 TaxID=1905758 RepID=UPI000BA65DA1|nr:UDP-N-acetylmuramate--L-alanine ligase [Helicobacter sp. 13S00401-1]PAF48212.1 UDP-N-acetylmuramate--L-alanine ligase [Helicobacter sp. 13S00401-1]